MNETRHRQKADNEAYIDLKTILKGILSGKQQLQWSFENSTEVVP